MLTAVPDLHSHQVVGWSLQPHIHGALVKDALLMAFRRKPAAGLVGGAARNCRLTIGLCTPIFRGNLTLPTTNAASSTPAVFMLLMAINALNVNEAAFPTLLQSGRLRNDLGLNLHRLRLRLRRRRDINDGRRLSDSIQGRFAAVPSNWSVHALRLS